MRELVGEVVLLDVWVLVRVVVRVLVLLEVGVVISHCAKVSSRNESSAELATATEASHFSDGVAKNPPATHEICPVTVPRLYSLTMLFRMALTALHSLSPIRSVVTVSTRAQEVASLPTVRITP